MKKLTIRVIVYFFVAICIFIFTFLYFFGDINKLKSSVEKNLKDQLNCTIYLGELDWDWDWLKLGVTTTEISLVDNDGNIVLQAGPTRLVWHIKDIITGNYQNFYNIDTTNLYLNAILHSDGIWNLTKLFPPDSPQPKIDNLKLHNSIIYSVDEFNPVPNKNILYKDLNITLGKKPFSNFKKIDLFTRVGSLTSPSLLKLKGTYADRKKFDWKKSQFNINITGEKLNLENWQGYLINLIKEPELKKIGGEFTGEIYLFKQKNNKNIKLVSNTNTNNLKVLLHNNGILQLIEIPKTDLKIEAFIDQKKINIKSLESNIDVLNYNLSGNIYKWSTPLPEVDLVFKTNKFNFKSVKPYLPLSLLPADTRARIEPINDEGLVEIDLKAKGPSIAPKYFGTILLNDFRLTSESGFLTEIKGLESKLILDDQILKIDHLTIPIENSLLNLKGEIDNKNLTTSFNLNGKNLNLEVLQDLLFQAGIQSTKANIESKGKLDLNLDVLAKPNIPPEIKGKLSFHDTGLSIYTDEPIEIKNAFGELSLDGSKVIFDKLSGLINNEDFFIDGNLSLKEDESVNLHVSAEHLKIIRQVLSFISAKTPLRPIAETVSGEANNLNLKIGGSLTKPLLDGMVLINNVSFSLPKLEEKISNITGNLTFKGTELIIEELNGMIQDTTFQVAGYLEDLFIEPKPRLRLQTGELKIYPFWNYIKEQLKTTSLNEQVKELETLDGIAALDIFLYHDAVLGNIYFKDGEIKYKPLPFGLNNLAGRLVIGEKNLSLFGVVGSINNSNNFNCDLSVFNYSDPKFNVQGRLALDLDPPALIDAVNPAAKEFITVEGLVPTLIDFDITLPTASLSVYSTLDETDKIEVAPYFKKPLNRNYTLSGMLGYDLEKNNLYLNQFNITGNNLSLTTNGTVSNVSSQDPEYMLVINTDKSSGLYMISEFFTPFVPYKVWGKVDLTSSISGTLSMLSFNSNATLKKVRAPFLFGKKLKAENGSFSFHFDNVKGNLDADISDIQYQSFMAKSALLSANYDNPVIYLNELKLDGGPGSIFAVGEYNPNDGSFNIKADGSKLELSNLGEFVFLDPSKISGKTDFALTFNSKGKKNNEIISNANGNLSFSATEGHLGQVELLEKGLKLANLFSQGIFGFNISNVFSLFFKYGEGDFNTLDGKADIKDGKVKVKEIHYRANELFLNTFGFVDLVNSLIGISVYGYLPEDKEQDGKEKINLKAIKDTTTKAVSGALSIMPEALKKRRIVIPFLHLTPPQFFKFEIKGNFKDQKKIMRRTARSFRWLRGRRLEREYKFVPK